MPKKNKQPLMIRSHLPLILLGSALAVFGLVTALVGGWFSSQAMRGCGYVSDIDPTPRVTAGVYEGEITQIDGRSTPLHGPRNRFELAAGQHVLVDAGIAQQSVIS